MSATSLNAAGDLVPGVDPALFVSDTLPADRRFMATVGNGYLGTRVYDKVMHVNGVYNGEAGECHRADVPSPAGAELNVAGAGAEDTSFTLNTRTGTFSCVIQSGKFRVAQRIFAHRTHVHLLALMVEAERLGNYTEPVVITINSTFTPHSQDIEFVSGPDFMGAKYIHGQTLTPEVKGGRKLSVHLLWTPLPGFLRLEPGEHSRSWAFLTAVAETEEGARRAYTQGLSLAQAGTLYPSHMEAWAWLWGQSRLEVTGSQHLSQALFGGLYYLMSSLPQAHTPDFLFTGLSPGGLPNGGRGQDYHGHVFWDQEIWMFPIVVMFRPDLAVKLLQYRVQTLGPARDIARQQGYQGAKYPWESAGTGTEVSDADIYGKREIHINGDISFAFRQYFYLTQDLEFFRNCGGWEVVVSIAEFWSSRVTWNPEEGCYDIKGVMPPDEYQPNINNSVYTSVVAKYSLQFAVELGTRLSKPVRPEWEEIAEKLKVSFDPERQYHPEYDGYTPGTDVKQADAVLLGFPLMYPMNPEVRRNDLEIYEGATDPDGPAMTWSMFAIGWLELKATARAGQLLEKCYKNIQEPFKVWSESADGSGAVNFLTGTGGFLQFPLFGCTGIRVRKDCLYFDPILLDNISELRITGISYLGNKLDFELTKELFTVVLTAAPGPQVNLLEAVLCGSGESFTLYKGQPVSFAPGPGKIQKQTSSCWLL
ncbi:protein-glucosylgalactosylhydroxylysine glucosidase isoform X1 [Callorhinchus milii]|uniref:Protein-glucosylgalactosylhydroxylysine glucosidase n=1 Tax=Callorhinchus milii TaxID=7868 RepID=J3SI31_CALMI|nr:protein-glucosylgalactosylhydroxylysine glucosidase isoform X1 [Callorhinchus milii]AFK10199.1 acid trehalase-like protein 1 [Callorhinchus milii]